MHIYQCTFSWRCPSHLECPWTSFARRDSRTRLHNRRLAVAHFLTVVRTPKAPNYTSNESMGVREFKVIAAISHRILQSLRHHCSASKDDYDYRAPSWYTRSQHNPAEVPGRQCWKDIEVNKNKCPYRLDVRWNSMVVNLFQIRGSISSSIKGPTQKVTFATFMTILQENLPPCRKAVHQFYRAYIVRATLTLSS